MRRATASVIATVLVLSAPVQSRATQTSEAAPAQPSDSGIEKGRAPYELVRTLQALQDQTALGNVAAHTAQRATIGHVGEQLAKAPREVWAERRNVRALVAFVLSGGPPDVLKTLMDEKVELPGVDAGLAVAAIAFAERRTDEVKTLLADVDPRKLEPGLAAHVALVQGIVFSDREPERALTSFSYARLLAPGTLVEQGALRRQSILASTMGRWHDGERLAAQYLRRFGNAVYAPAFYREIVEALAAQSDTRDEAQLARLKDLFAMLGEKERRQTYLFLAERSVLAGKVKLARFAAARANELYDAASREAARSVVYGAAADVVSEKIQEGVDALSQVDRGKLGRRDTLLIDAAVEVATDVRRAPKGETETAETALAEPASIEAAPGSGEAESSPVMQHARKSLTKADELLKVPK